jgi:YgiT-type zinc finger domain-containing protein
MPCTAPGCTDFEAREIAHAVVYRSRRLTIDHVPAEVCPHCGDARLTEETLEEITVLLVGLEDGPETGAPGRLHFGEGR